MYSRHLSPSPKNKTGSLEHKFGLAVEYPSLVMKTKQDSNSSSLLGENAIHGRTDLKRGLNCNN